MASKEVIDELGHRVARLIEEHRSAKASCKALGEECLALKEENRSLRERIRELDSELALLQLSEGLAGDSRNKDKARARVNRLMREVDRCIAIVGKRE